MLWKYFQLCSKSPFHFQIHLNIIIYREWNPLPLFLLNISKYFVVFSYSILQFIFYTNFHCTLTLPTPSDKKPPKEKLSMSIITMAKRVDYYCNSLAKMGVIFSIDLAGQRWFEVKFLPQSSPGISKVKRLLVDFSSLHCSRKLVVAVRCI